MLLPIEFEKLNEADCQFIDVRSPSEFAQETIPGALNLPIFDDEERKIIGTLYKQDSSEKAKRLGIEYVAKKLPYLYDRILEIRRDTGKKLVLFCARGGMRSTSLALLLNGVGEGVSYLKGGYKGYRKAVMKDLPLVNQGVHYIVIHGKTGVGKTELLKRLHEAGYPVLDLEGGANHRGSILGSVGLGDQPTTKAFESYIYHTLKNRTSDFVFVEAESRRIGKLFVPAFVKDKMQEGTQVLVDASLDFRANHLVKEYTGIEPGEPELIHGVNRLTKYIGKDRAAALIEDIEQGNFHGVARELMVNYYDPMYQHSIDKYTFDHSLLIEDFEDGAQQLGAIMNQVMASHTQDEDVE